MITTDDLLGCGIDVVGSGFVPVVRRVAFEEGWVRDVEGGEVFGGEAAGGIGGDFGVAGWW